MKKFYLGLLIVLSLSAAPAFAAAKNAASSAKAAWKPLAPNGYTSIDWVKAPGVASFFKTPDDNGAIDFLTRIYLPQNQIKFIISATPPVDLNSPSVNAADPAAASPAGSGADMNTLPNLSFERLGAEDAKTLDPSTKFIWDASFFNMKTQASDLSMAVKYSINGNTTITSGSRSVPDMAKPRRMLLIDNQAGKATIEDFDPAIFTDSKSGDQALEGFAPTVVKTDGPGGTASRLFLGVSDDGQQLIVYCSQLATVKEASDALAAAGASSDHQMEADGGDSAACGYNLPGQFFVEPTRTLPLLMGATTILARGKVAIATMNVRTGPSTKYPVIAQLPKGTDVQAFGELNGWYRIGDGKWALKSLIK